MKYALPYGIALAVFVVLDFLWIGLIARGIYTARIGEMLLDRPRWGVAVLFYLLYVVGLVYFAIAEGLNSGNWAHAALNGALFGFFTYLTYNATNLSVMKDYDPLVAVIDTGWGTFMGAAVPTATLYLATLFGRGTAP
jgi:uncharacterized membrane protein